jgi:S-adenosylmethionine-diacylglycerol 3-amino-3-carboxypropyl transferase
MDAATLPLAFAQVREDPRLDHALAARLPADASVAMIASGGETALCLERLPLRRLHLVDMNPAQLALTRFKRHLSLHATPREAAACLGHMPMPETRRQAILNPWLDREGLPPHMFGPPELVAHLGCDHSGRYERAFARLREALAPHQAEWQALLRLTDPADAAARVAPDTKLGASLDAAFAQVFALANLVCLFGTEATQNPSRLFHEHFAWRTRVALERHPPVTNPFLWQIFAGRFPPNHMYDWLQTPSDARISRPETVYHQGKMAAVLAAMTPASLDLVHLSNILDWLSPAEAEASLAAAAHALKPGGFVIIRQLNSSLDIAAIGSDFRWDHALGAEMEARDRSFFYPKIFIGMRA